MLFPILLGAALALFAPAARAEYGDRDQHNGTGRTPDPAHGRNGYDSGQRGNLDDMGGDAGFGGAVGGADGGIGIGGNH